MARCWLAALALVACSADRPTGLDLTIELIDARLDQVRVEGTMEDRDEVVGPEEVPEIPRRLASPETLLLLVPSAWDGSS